MKKVRLIQCIRFAAISLLIMVGTSHAQPAEYKPESLAYSPQLSWTVDSWTADDRPYTAIRDAVSKAIKQGQSAVGLANTYKVEAARKPFDPQLVFRYAYATYQASLHDAAFGNTSALYEARNTLQGLRPTHTYEVTRLHFLMAGTSMPLRTLLPVGERLLKHNPNDFYVKYCLVKTLDGANFPQDERQQKALSQELVRTTPNSPSVQAMLGSTYFGIWTRTKSEADKAQSLAAFQKYLRLSQPGDAYRNHVQFCIDWLKQGQVPIHAKA